jgi:hypothetical protein
MAQSPSHKFGQIIGDLLEAAVFHWLQTIASDFGLYLDYKHLRPAREERRTVSWKDSKGNQHDLDYVLEQVGSEQTIGRPKAFIETAWRRYTKHSRNKVQEIQGAIGPLAETYADCHPFLGVVLAGEFTSGSLNQLRSHGFQIVHYPYESVVRLLRPLASMHISMKPLPTPRCDGKAMRFTRFLKRKNKRSSRSCEIWTPPSSMSFFLRCEHR